MDPFKNIIYHPTEKPLKWPELISVFAEQFPRIVQIATDNFEAAQVFYRGEVFQITPCFPPEKDGHNGRFGFEVYGPVSYRLR